MRPRDRRPKRADVRIALGELNQFSERLSIPDSVVAEAANICIDSLGKGLESRKPLTRITATSLYAACREKEVPTTLDDVAVASGVDRDEVAKCYRLMVRELDLKIPVPRPARFMSRVAFRAKVSPRVEAAALEILSRAGKAGITAGAYPLGLAASALYVASILEGEKLTEGEAADAAGVAESTVRKEYRRLWRILE